MTDKTILWLSSTSCNPAMEAKHRQYDRCNDDLNVDHRWSQKKILLKRANIKKNCGLIALYFNDQLKLSIDQRYSHVRQVAQYILHHLSTVTNDHSKLSAQPLAKIFDDSLVKKH